MDFHISLSDKEKKELLQIARNAIECCFEGDDSLQNKIIQCRNKLIARYSALNVPVLKESLACFVTLSERDDDQLRGCIGNVETRKDETLLQNIISKSIMAAFMDSRFEPLEASELSEIKIEISIVSKPRPITFNTKEELFSLVEGKGVVLQSGFRRATLLPQVWQQLPEPPEFLSHLALKAGISAMEYENASYEIYEVYSFEES
ncbi:MAG: hypothetical protein IEMM0006_0845 [bacterium]|nr:MAG: hypothetical protein IEMM0006_0845 [bacterium]